MTAHLPTRRFTGALILVTAVTAVLLLSGLPAHASPGATTRVSVDSAGNEGNSESREPAISADGRYVAFESHSSNLVPGDTNDNWDIFVYDRQTGKTTRVSVDSSGNQANNDSHFPAISADGRYVAFQSYASNLVPGDTNDNWDIFVHDRQTGKTTRVSVDSAGNEVKDLRGYSGFPAISADGRYVAFLSLSSKLVPGDTNGARDIFVHDGQTGETTRVSVDSTGNQGDADSWFPSISANGRYVAFESQASNLVPGDTNNAADVFVHDRQTGETTRVSVDSAGNQGDAQSGKPAISADGRYVAFESRASNLVPGDTNGGWDIFVHDRQTGETSRVSVDSAGNQGNADSHFEAMSADGRYLAFLSQASNLVPGDTNNAADIFVHDRQTGETTRVSVDSTGNEGSIQSSSPSRSPATGSAGAQIVAALSGDGRYVAFASDDTNLVPGDTNGYPDVFVYDRGASAVGGAPESSNASDSSSPNYVAIAGLAAVAALAVIASAWYARRRWLR